MWTSGPSLPAAAERSNFSRTQRLLVAVTVPASTSFLIGQLGWLRERGYDVHLVSAPGHVLDEMGRREGVTVHPVPMRREVTLFADLVSLVRLTVLIARLRPDVVSAGTPKAGLLVGVAAFLTRVPRRVYILHGLRLEGAQGALRVILRIMERIACGAAHTVICVSPSLRDVIVREGIVPLRKTHVVRSGSCNGVDPEDFGGTPARVAAGATVRAQLGIDPQDPVIGFVGRLNHEKGLTELLAAHAVLCEELSPAPHLVLVGSDEGFPVGTSAGVHAVGHVDDVTPYYSLMDVLAFPTYREGLGNVVLEAACAGVPAVVTDVTGSIDSVVDGVTGIVVRVGDARGLAAALRTLLEDPDRRATMGSAARARVIADFRPLDVWAGLLTVYRARALDSVNDCHVESVHDSRNSVS